MYTQNTESIVAALRNHGVDLDIDAKIFYADVWETVELSERSDDVTVANKKLRKLYKNYFSRTQEWINRQKQKTNSDAWCALGQAYEKEARALKEPFEKSIYRHALCYMHLHRLIALSRKMLADIVKITPNYRISEGVKISNATGFLLKRAYKQRRANLQKKEKLMIAKAVLKDLDDLFDNLLKNLKWAYKFGKGKQEYTSFRAALRQGDFEAAQLKCDAWKSKENCHKTALKILLLIQDHQLNLALDNGTLLNSSDIDLVFSFVRQEEKRLEKFIDKYAIPYMLYQLQSLIKLGYRLGQMGSLESMLVLHAKMIAGLALPLSDEVAAKKYESDILTRIRHLQSQYFIDLGGIFDDMELTYERLQDVVSEYDFAQKTGPDRLFLT